MKIFRALSSNTRHPLTVNPRPFSRPQFGERVEISTGEALSTLAEKSLMSTSSGSIAGMDSVSTALGSGSVSGGSALVIGGSALASSTPHSSAAASALHSVQTAGTSGSAGFSAANPVLGGTSQTSVGFTLLGTGMSLLSSESDLTPPS
ncbi:MAG: hypothetical protein K2X01_03225 [Cyanobacteria bacterium]|nr:hypothetical protein [Cyanobacteriota bacterium]